MPSASELGLTTEQWELLARQVENPVWRIRAYRWNPEFELQTVGDNRHAAFDAVEWQGSLYRLTTSGFDRLVNTVWVNDEISAPPALQALSSPVSLIAADALYAFVLTSTGIALSSYDGLSWSAWAEIISDATISFMAAVSADRVHYVTYDSAHRRFRFVVAQLSETWVVSASQIHWGFQITSFSAETLNGVDTLLFTSETPGIISNKVVSTQVVKEYLPAMSVCAITYKYGTWSDHLFVDYIDLWSSSRYRLYARLSKIEGTLWLTCYSSESDNAGVGNAITGYRVYSSKDGRHWSRGEHLPMPIGSNRGLIFVLFNQRLYAFTDGDVYTAPATLRFSAAPHASTVLDVSDRLDYLSVSRQDMQSIQLTLHNPDNFTFGTFLDGSCTVALTIETGYWDTAHDEAILALHGTYEIDTITPTYQNPDQMLELAGRDRMAWMTSLSQSEQFHYWQPQVNAGDAYIDTTDTGYGGMSHSAVVKGAYKAFNGTLQIISNNEDAQCWSTFLDDSTWNGTLETLFGLALLGNQETAGILFRAQDKDNYWRYYYEQATDTLRLIQVIAGAITTHWASAAKGWSGSLVSRVLRLDAYYCRIRLFSDADYNHSFILEQEVIVPGQAAYSSHILPDGEVELTLAPNPQSGYFGTAGKGYNPTDVPSLPPLPLPPPSLPPGYKIVLPEAIRTHRRFWCLGDHVNQGTELQTRAARLGADDISWIARVPAIGYIDHVTIAGATNPFNRGEKWIITENQIWRSLNFWDNPTIGPDGFFNGAWEHMASIGTLFLDWDIKLRSIAFSPTREGFIMVSALNGRIATSTDGGETWTSTIIVSNSASPEHGSPLFISPWNDEGRGDILALVGHGSTYSPKVLYRSPNWGAIWQLWFWPESNIGFGYHFECIHVPYRHANGRPNYGGQLIYAIMYRTVPFELTSYTEPHLFRSDNGGHDWTDVGMLPISNITPDGWPQFHYPKELDVHPSSANYIRYVSGQYYIHSENGGETWMVTDTGFDGVSLAHVEGWPYDPQFALMYGRSSGSQPSLMAFTEDGETFTDIESLLTSHPHYVTRVYGLEVEWEF